MATGTITATIDEKVTTVNTVAQGMRAIVGGESSISIFGFQGAGIASDQIAITVILLQE